MIMNKENFDLWLEELFSYEYLTECIPNREMHELFPEMVSLFD